MSTLTNKIKILLKYVQHLLRVVIFFIFRIFPINHRKIVISNFYGRGYGDNAKYIVEKIIEQKLDFEIIWLCKEMFTYVPKNVKKVKYNSIKSFWEMVTAKIWIDNCRKPLFVQKRRGQFYIQTWHGGIALKKIEKDVEEKLNKVYLKEAKHDSKIADLFISNSKFCTELYRSAFWYDGPILKSGYPRNDILLKKPLQIKKRVFEYFGLDSETRIVLYAPTFRADYNIEVYKIEFHQVLRALKERYGNNWVFLVRLHPNIAEKADLLSYNEQIINATDYGDMQELMVASDLLITDYSSTMFEFALDGRPVILFAPDSEEYKKDRDFYFNLNDLPFPIANNNNSLIKLIIEFDQYQYTKKLQDFMQSIELEEKGNSSQVIIDYIIKVTDIRETKL